MKITGRVKIYKKRGVKNGKEYIWEQAMIIVRADDKDKLKELDGKEITLYTQCSTVDNSTSTTEKLTELAKTVNEVFDELSEKEIEKLMKNPKFQKMIEILKEVLE